MFRWRIHARRIVHHKSARLIFCADDMEWRMS
jgi:hypothetical protein